MNKYFPLILIAGVVSIILFGYMRNRQAKRNDERRERLWQKQEELMELLHKKNEAADEAASKNMEDLN